MSEDSDLKDSEKKTRGVGAREWRGWERGEGEGISTWSKAKPFYISSGEKTSAVLQKDHLSRDLCNDLAQVCSTAYAHRHAM